MQLQVRRARNIEKLLKRIQRLKSKRPSELTAEERRLLQRWYLTVKGSRSLKMDLRYASKKTPAKVETWLKHPERYDIPEVDTPTSTIDKGKAKAEEPRKVKVEFRVGVGATGSGYPIKELVWVMPPNSNAWLTAQELGAKVDWNYITRRKLFGNVTLELPVGSIVKRYEWYRKEGGFKYFLVTPEGLKELPFTEETRVIKQLDDKHAIVAKYRVVDADGRKVEDLAAVYVKGPMGALIQPRHSLEEAKQLEEELYAKAKPRAELYLEAVKVKGDVYKIKDELKKLGFKWDAITSSWVLSIRDLYSKEQFEQIVKRLEELGVDTSELKALYEKYKGTYEKYWERKERAFEHAKKLLGVEPLKVYIYPEQNKIAVKLPHLGPEKFKELRRQYEYKDGHFILPFNFEAQSA